VPAWTKNNIKKRTVTLVGTTTFDVETDPASIPEAAAADSQIGYLNVEKIDATISLKVYRFQGSRPDLLKQIDTAAFTTITAAGVYEIAFNATYGAATKTRISVVNASGTAEAIFEYDDVYRVSGG